MQFDLHSHARDDTHVVYDAHLQARAREVDPETMARQGDAILFRADSPGKYRFRVFVDEQPTELVRKGGTVIVKRKKLSVPSGKLTVSGCCDLSDGETSGTVESKKLPSGTYHVEILEVPSDILVATEVGRFGMMIESGYSLVGSITIIATVLGIPLVLMYAAQTENWAIVITLAKKGLPALALAWLFLFASAALVPALKRSGELTVQYHLNPPPEIWIYLQRSCDDDAAEVREGALFELRDDVYSPLS